MPSRRAFRLLLTAALGALLGAGCELPPPPPDAPSGPARLELGEGVPFRRIEDGDVLVLSRGTQGAQHVCVGLRASGVRPRGVLVRLWMTRDADGATVTEEFRVPLSFYPPDAGGGPAAEHVEVDELALQFPNGDGATLPEGVLATDLTLHGEIVDRDGRVAGEARRVRVAWGPSPCSAFAFLDAGARDAGLDAEPDGAHDAGLDAEPDGPRDADLDAGPADGEGGETLDAAPSDAGTSALLDGGHDAAAPETP